jgi:Zn-dependent protease with chaperone function
MTGTWAPGVADAAVLAVLAVTLAQPASARLADARWPARAPRAALALWLGTGLACGLAGVGALLSLGLAPLGVHLLPGLARLAAALTAGRDPLPASGWVAVATALALLGRQVGVLVRCLVSVAANRRAHRDLLDVVGTWAEDLGSVVLEDARPLAYHLPGLRDARVVVTRGCVERTAGPALAAVLAHERAHARGHHHLVLQAFAAWQRTFPFLPAAAASTAAVALLTELLADDAAVAEAGAGATLAALDAIGCGPDADTAARTRKVRLAGGLPRLALPARLACYAAAGLVLVLPTMMLVRPR